MQGVGNRGPHYNLHPLETKIIFESQIKETTYIEVVNISYKSNERQKEGFIMQKEYMAINSISNKTAYNELKDMAEKGLVRHGANLPTIKQPKLCFYKSI
ncbi:MAG: hypothetical protein U9Q37_02980 [Euryarchaeota archaeon]|nr:hypothetical protein [Euryarchaeota archaeon]